MDIILSWETIAALFLVAAAAGFVDALAGGGGLLTIPALLLSGLPPVSALATNKLQACAGSFSASLTLVKKGVAHPGAIRRALVLAFIGSAIGTVLVQLSPAQMLTVLIPFLIAGIGLYTLFAPSLGQTARPPKISRQSWQRYIVPSIGFYDGYFGPATGTFFSLSQAVLRGTDLVRATADAKLLNFATNLASLIFFLLGGHIVWLAGLAMMAGQALGAFFGARMVVKGGTRLIRPMMVMMCFAMVAKYVFFS
ncbi:TSUP family transporter [Neisseria shayeganii]|uniref:Probable membrane transporter protein n=2 Tax=Neisseria shayeganii TaxID=607712 RepID=G4CGE3_9NEIS|nr:TSUP family transporter [Neisseria shayeganii]EGY53191.1 inner membrane protein YfcA [Neisseria shayeganii 871]QMT39615.1 TSUP family transporter [Neisseria shayeganii]